MTISFENGPTLVGVINRKVRDNFKILIETYEMAFDSIFKKDFSLSNKALAQCKEIENKTINLENKKLNEHNKISLYVVLSRLQAKSSIIKEIAEIGLDRA